jgi:hypothetical protein
MRALEELPDHTKNAMLPLMPLRPWVGSNYLQSSIDRITRSYGDRPVIVSVGDREPAKDRPVFAELDRLRDPHAGFANWCDLIEEKEGNFIPVAQIGIDARQEAEQIRRLHSIGNGLVIHLSEEVFGSLASVAVSLATLTEGGQDVCIVLDYGAARADHLEKAARTVGYINTLRSRLPQAHVAVSASSFPSSFSNLPEQEIYERRLFNSVTGELGSPGLIYSDRGSARAEPLGGGGAAEIPARIDYPRFDEWTFFRAEHGGFTNYVDQAQRLMGSDAWNGGLRVWGTQMIERTARGDRSAIDNPQKATAARINLHLQLQTFYDEPDEVEDTEDDWED